MDIRTHPAEETEAEKISRAYLNYLSPDPASSAVRTKNRSFDGTVDLSVIVPCYNVEKYLDRCVNSVLSQEMTHTTELILVNDGSTDGTGEILDGFRDIPGVTVIEQENRGLAGARNTGMDAAKGRYLFFLDSDDFLAPGSLNRFLNAAIKADAEITEAGMLYVLPGREDIADIGFDGEPVPVEPFSLTGYACGKLFRSSLFDNIDFPSGYWFEDTVISWLLFPKSVRSCHYDGIVYCYRQNAQGLSASAAKGDPRTADTWWITEQMYRDLRTLNIPVTQPLYESVLDQIVLNCVRAAALSPKARTAVFTLTAAWHKRYFANMRTQIPRLEIVERALGLGDLTLYEKACAAAWHAKSKI